MNTICRLLIFVLILTAVQSFAQKNPYVEFVKEVPNYVKAENSDFVVAFVSSDGMGFKTTYTYAPENGISAISSEGPSSDLVKALSEIVKKKFNSMGLYPQGYMAYSMPALMEDPTIFTKQLQKFDKLPFYVLNITIEEIPSLEKDMKKGMLNPGNVKSNGLSVSAIDREAAKETYNMTKYFSTLEKVLDKYEKEMNKQDESYYIKHIENRVEKVEITEEDQKNYDKLVKINERVYSWPDNNELSKSKIVVYYPGDYKDKRREKIKKLLEKYYPYTYEVNTEGVTYENLAQYDYMFVWDGQFVNVTTSTREDPFDRNSQYKNRTTVGTLMYVGIKDLNTNNLYIGPEESKIVEQASLNQSEALENTLKAMSEDLGWEK